MSRRFTLFPNAEGARRIAVIARNPNTGTLVSCEPQLSWTTIPAPNVAAQVREPRIGVIVNATLGERQGVVDGLLPSRNRLKTNLTDAPIPFNQHRQFHPLHSPRCPGRPPPLMLFAALLRIRRCPHARLELLLLRTCGVCHSLASTNFFTMGLGPLGISSTMAIGMGLPVSLLPIPGRLGVLLLPLGITGIHTNPTTLLQAIPGASIALKLPQ